MSAPAAQTLFRNRMNPSNWAFMSVGFLAAIGFLVADGTPLLTASLWIVGLALVTFLVLVPVFVLLGRSQVAELSLEGSVLCAEMIAMFGRGRLHLVPVAEAANWRIENRRTLRFSHAGRDFALPLRGASYDEAVFTALAPDLAGKWPKKR